ncbi:hypothetical protein GCM10008938_45730 [Deinococcus roseus]|uniref:Uncharacterized protein n=1 Tax=Deinococcus roseus TaxID=392414 RepID=A0ABQ2DI10_9DEIO|nr:hypothetical protein GCM10008938_45730 [Deinococcus roseus]
MWGEACRLLYTEVNFTQDAQLRKGGQGCGQAVFHEHPSPCRIRSFLAVQSPVAQQNRTSLMRFAGEQFELLQ